MPIFVNHLFSHRTFLLFYKINVSFRFFFTVPILNMEALLGETIYLPCNVSAHDVNDDVILVLWYRADKGTPVYRYSQQKNLNDFYNLLRLRL